MDSRAKDAFKQQSQLENDRSVLDSHYKEIAERVLPRQDDFLTSNRMEGEKRTDKIFDSTAPLALDRAASAIDSLITPSTQMYQGLEPEDERLLEDKATMMFLDELNKSIFRMRYRPMANFASQAHECYVSLMAFGTLGMFTDDMVGVNSRYKSISMVELYIAENAAGIVDLSHRKFQLSARAAVNKPEFRGKLPEKIVKEAERNPFMKFDFLHCVRPNYDMKPGKMGPEGMPWYSCYLSYEGEAFITEGGYRTMPYAISRHVTAPREVYGRSPAMQVLPDIKMLNEMEKTIIRAAHKIVDPPLLAHGDGILNAFSTRPNAINYGGVNEQGHQLVAPMKMGSNLPIALDMSEQKRKVINDAFYVTLFQILVQNPQMTATEALIRAQEKGQLLAPTVGRQQSEFLGTVTAREIDILDRAGMIRDMPDKLRRSGGGIKAVYTNPLSRLRRAEEAVAMSNTISSIAPLAEIKPHILDNYDEDEIARLFHEVHGAPARTMRTKEQVAQIRSVRAEQAAQAQQLEGAESVARIAKDGAKASELMNAEA